MISTSTLCGVLDVASQPSSASAPVISACTSARMPIDVGLLQEIRVTLNRCRVLGTERFKDAIEATLARHVRLGKAGRQRKPCKAQELLASAESASVRA